MPPQIISGDIREHDPSEYKSALQASGVRRIDTAAIYTNATSEGKIGGARLPEDFVVDTKIYFVPPSADGSLTADKIDKSVANSLKALGLEKVNVLYCHAPDFTTPIAEQAKAFDEVYRKGWFTYLGVSNFPPSMVEEWLTIAADKGYVKPSVYQGQYNLLCRGYEKILYPLLRRHGMVLNAYSPLGGGFLLGNLTAQGVQGGQRFSTIPTFRIWYDQPKLHDGVVRLRAISEKTGIGMEELSLRWLMHHSTLKDGDGIIIGMSNMAQIENNIKQMEKGPLEEGLAAELNALWEVVEEDAMKIVDHDTYFMGIKRA